MSLSVNFNLGHVYGLLRQRLCSLFHRTWQRSTSSANLDHYAQLYPSVNLSRPASHQQPSQQQHRRRPLPPPTASPSPLISRAAGPTARRRIKDHRHTYTSERGARPAATRQQAARLTHSLRRRQFLGAAGKAVYYTAGSIAGFQSQGH